MNLVEIFRPGAEVPEPEAVLTGAERRHWSGLRSEKRRRDWLLGRQAAKALFRRHQALAPDWVEILNRPSGEPFARVGPAGSESPRTESPWTLSLSHSDGLGVAAANTEGLPVGVDAELVEARSKAWAEFCFRPEEIELAHGAPESLDEALTRLWTAKEAVLKLLGLGLSTDLKEVILCPEGTRLEGRAEAVWRRMGSPRPLLQSRRLERHWATLAAVEEGARWTL